MAIWKNISGFPGYEISDVGQVRSLKRRVKIIMKQYINHFGYPVVNLTLDKSKQKVIAVHRLVAFSFIHNPENKPFINHKNGIKTDYRIENLEWCTASENQQHAYDTGLNRVVGGQGEDHKRSKLTECQVKIIRDAFSHGLAKKAIARYFRVSPKAIYAIVNRQSWSHI